MKNLSIIFILLLALGSSNIQAQRYGSTPREMYGAQLNLGAGIGYYGYAGRPAPALMLNVELDIARNITLAPFIGYYTYRNDYYWGNYENPYRYYNYRETVIPVGAKGTYYFDELFRASERWDFYAAASLGFAFHSVSWDRGYYGDPDIVTRQSPLYGTAHIGSRLHVTPGFGLFLDLSTGISTFGISFRL